MKYSFWPSSMRASRWSVRTSESCTLCSVIVSNSTIPSYFYERTKTMAPTMTAPSVYSIGSLVEVDSTKTGYIMQLNNTDSNNVCFIVQYCVGNEIENNIHQSRYRPVILRRASALRFGTLQQAIPQSNDPPPLISPPTFTTVPLQIAAPPIPHRTIKHQQLQKALKDSRSWISSHSKDHPLYQILKNRKTKEKGWMFEIPQLTNVKYSKNNN